ncbi:hypothetical protein CYMTET_40475 [Cymbomonas tetramitiformis]|uniref:HAT C-terminal dimerisation domain-containing protein n=1 Tax=Cymbomonas tetramitiformis TaxID=36881 RepID=A0AAE0C927_9CHLO|nr:hypothetical protein CYMTET_40475 [Cymbomonas tetramitiformis]
MTSNAIDILQSTSIVTASLVLPVIGRLTYKLDAETPIKYGGEFVKLAVVELVAARETLWEQVESRFYNVLLDCKLEDFAVATFLDPRYKGLDFHNLERWKKGELTAGMIIDWARQAYEADCRPTKAAPASIVVVPAPPTKISKLVAFLEDSDDDEEGSARQDYADVEVVDEEQDEFALYLALATPPKSEDPLVWSSKNEGKLPNLARMARQFLAPPASTGGV